MEFKKSVLFEYTSLDVHKLRDLHKVNPYDARVYYLCVTGDYVTETIKLYEGDNGDFSIVFNRVNYGISTTCKWYSHNKNITSLIYKGGLFYLRKNGGSKLTQLTFHGMSEFKDCVRNEIIDFLTKKFSWVRFIVEHSELWNTAFNTFIRNKLYSYNKAVKHIYKTSLPVMRVLVSGVSVHNIYNLRNVWLRIRGLIDNVENLRLEMLSNEYFMDACRLAYILGRKVNASWSLNRLKAERNNWSDEVTNILFLNAEIVDLHIAKVYLDFAKENGFELFRTNKELAIEGARQRHCVGSYSFRVNTGECAIFNYKGYTVDIRYLSEYNTEVGRYQGEKKIKIVQILGYKNTQPSVEIWKELELLASNFNSKLTVISKINYDFNLELLSSNEEHLNDVNVVAPIGYRSKLEIFSTDIFNGSSVEMIGVRQEPAVLLVADPFCTVTAEDIGHELID